MGYYNLLLFILFNAGIAVGVTRSELTKPFRLWIKAKSAWWYNLFTCPMCFGLYSAVPCYLIIAFFISVIWVQIIVFAFVGSFTAYFLNRISNIG